MVCFLLAVRDFSVLQSTQTGSGACPASYLVDTRGCICGSKWLECEADHSLASGVEVKKNGAIPPLLYLPICHEQVQLKFTIVLLLLNKFWG